MHKLWYYFNLTALSYHLLTWWNANQEIKIQKEYKEETAMII